MQPSARTDLDLGDAIVNVPCGTVDLLRRLLEALTDDDWDRARAGFGDAELASE